jgi:hypothetical protein
VSLGRRPHRADPCASTRRSALALPPGRAGHTVVRRHRPWISGCQLRRCGSRGQSICSTGSGPRCKHLGQSRSPSASSAQAAILISDAPASTAGNYRSCSAIFSTCCAGEATSARSVGQRSSGKLRGSRTECLSSPEHSCTQICLLLSGSSGPVGRIGPTWPASSTPTSEEAWSAECGQPLQRHDRTLALTAAWSGERSRPYSGMVGAPVPVCHLP